MPAIQEAEAKEPVTFLGLSPEQIEAIRKAMPEFGPSKIAAGTYLSLDKDYVTIGMFNFAIGRADLPDDLVYQLVKAVFENQPRLVESYAGGKRHPPAERYERHLPAVSPRRGPLLSRDRHQRTRCAGFDALIGPAGGAPGRMECR